MFTANKESIRCKLTNPDITRCLDPHDPTLHPSKHHHADMSWKAIETIIIRKPVHILKLPMVCSATSSNFYLPPRYETTNLDVNVSLNMANLHMINISALDFCIWQHLRNNWSEMQLQHLTTIPSIPVHKIYQHIINGTQQIMPFDTDDESTEDTDSIWTLFSHTGMYITAIGLLISAGLGLFCCYFFWCWPARLVCQPLEPGNMQYTIVDDDVEVAPIYRHDGKVLPPTRPRENHCLALECLPIWTENWYKQQSKHAAIASLQFWTADLNPITLGITTEEVYSSFFSSTSTSTYTFWQQPDKILFGHVMTTLNAAFEWQLALEDEGYESGSGTINMPTPLKKCQESITYPASNMLHSIPIWSCHTVCLKLHPDQYADD